MPVVNAVFSGSGMDLLDHAGAVWGLDEKYYRFKALAGVSGGSIIAAALAAGFSPGKELNDLILSFLPVSTKLLDPAVKFPWQKEAQSSIGSMPWWWPFSSHGVVKGKKLISTLDKLLATKGVKHFKDLKIPLKVFTTNVTDCRPQEWSQEKTPDAKVAPVVVASCRIPGVFQGAVFDGDEHVDGGVWNNFPIDAFNNQVDGSSNLGEGTVGFFFGVEPSSVAGLGYWPALINLMMASRMTASVDSAPKAKVLRLPGGDSMDFNLSADRAKAKLEVSRAIAKLWVERQG